MATTRNKIKISVFCPTDHTYSIDRYARELSRNFPSIVEAKVIEYPTSKGLLRKQMDRFWGYPRFAADQQGDFNVIIAEAYAYLLKSLPGKNTICVCHDLHGLTYTGSRTPQYWFYRLRYLWALKFLGQAKFIVTTSQNTKNELLNFCPELQEERIIPVHNGIEDRWKAPTSAELHFRVRQKLGLETKRFVLYVGNDLWYKNVAGLIWAFSKIDKQDISLVYVGKLRPETLVIIQRLKIENRMILLANLSDDELAVLYQAAEMLVFPSFSEGFGWPPLEAMASGCPTICSTAGSLREICGDASIFVDPYDIDGMVNAINRVSTEKSLRHDLIARGYAQAAKFSWRSTANTFMELFLRP